MNIKRLDAQTVNQIAAGEVVERPAHLVKELIENSLDAGATEIEIEIDHGGRSVRVSDNGHGIEKEALGLAIARFATSKISSTSDIYALSTFGFRGEALASIASVCNLQLTSRVKNAEAHQLVSRFGETLPVVPVSRDPGTTVQIDDLFQNLPVRLSFLKSDASEVSQIKNVLKAMALVHPEVSFRVQIKGQLVFLWPAVRDAMERVAQVLEHDELYLCEGSYDGIEVKAWVSPPHKTLPTSRNIWLFAQRRWIQDRALQAAVLDAYRNLLMHGEYPTAVVSVTCDPEDVDVNVHPTKSQVKFRRPAFRAVAGTLRQTLEKAPWLPNILSPADNRKPPSPFQGFQTPQFAGPEFERVQYQRRDEPAKLTMNDLRTASLSRQETAIHKTSVPTPVRWADLEVLGQAHLTYIVAESTDKLILIDQHAAHERVAFEKLMQGFEKKAPESQEFLIPLTFHMEESLIEALFKQSESLIRLGVHIDRQGPETLVLTAAPVLIKESAVVTALEKMALGLSEKGESAAVQQQVAEACAQMACHSVVRAGQSLSHSQMTELLKAMDEFPLSSFCPHGRPVFVEFPFLEIERDFGRIS